MSEQPQPPSDPEITLLLECNDHVRGRDGRFYVSGYAGWRAWIGDSQHGDVVRLTPDIPLDEVWPRLRQQYEAERDAVMRRDGIEA